jgi:2-beta-glucuronyltransferase
MHRVVLFSAHYMESKRRADPHFIANAYWRNGWDVVFFTVGISHISRLRRDHRFQYPIMAEANRLKSVKERLSSFVWFRPWHPINLRNSVLNRLSSPFFQGMALRQIFHLVLKLYFVLCGSNWRIKQRFAG